MPQEKSTKKAGRFVAGLREGFLVRFVGLN
jgi:hypothetical protein